MEIIWLIGNFNFDGIESLWPWMRDQVTYLLRTLEIFLKYNSLSNISNSGLFKFQPNRVGGASGKPMASCLCRPGLNPWSDLFFSAHATICLLGVGLLLIIEWCHTFFSVLYHHLAFKINNCNQCTKKDKITFARSQERSIFKKKLDDHNFQPTVWPNSF